MLGKSFISIFWIVPFDIFMSLESWERSIKMSSHLYFMDFDDKPLTTKNLILYFPLLRMPFETEMSHDLDSFHKFLFRKWSLFSNHLRKFFELDFLIEA